MARGQIGSWQGGSGSSQWGVLCCGETVHNQAARSPPYCAPPPTRPSKTTNNLQSTWVSWRVLQMSLIAY